MLNFTRDWFSQNILQWKKNLRKFAGKENLHFLEIGTFEGRAAIWLLRNILTHPTSKITCIDNWTFENQNSDLDLTYMESNFDHNMSIINRANSVCKASGNSSDILRTLPFNTFDFIYIDGSHIAPDVLEDAVLSWKLLKIGGLMTFDDYTWGKDRDLLDRPEPAIDAFLSIFQNQYKLIEKNKQVTIEKLDKTSCSEMT